MGKLRLLCWGLTNLEELEDICDKLYKNDELEVCVCISMGNLGVVKKKDYLIVIDSRSLDENTVELINYNEEPALDKEILTKMLPYESCAIELGMRRTNVPIVEYTREQQRYYRELRHINYIYEKFNINAFFAGAVPHYQDVYIAYVLAQIYKVPSRFFVPSPLRNRRLVAKTIETIGNEMGEYYQELPNKEEYELIAEDIVRYYETQTLPIEELKKIKSPGTDAETKNVLNSHKEHYWGVWKKSHQIIWNPLTRYLKRLYTLKRDSGENIDSNRKKMFYQNYMEEHELVNFYMKYYKFTLDQYNEIAEVPDYNRKYIYFALQFVPEATTLPQAGVFSSQYLSIQLLAKCAEKFNLSVYVKEHGHLAWRNKHFYDEIAAIPNVKFIKSKINTYEVIENCVAVSTQTGTCILEGVLQNKPALVFGDGYLWKEMPGVFQIENYEQGCSVIRDILDNKYEINKNELRKYMYAIQNKSVIYKTASDISNIEKRENRECLEKIFKDLLSDVRENY